MTHLVRVLGLVQTVMELSFVVFVGIPLYSAHTPTSFTFDFHPLSFPLPTLTARIHWHTLEEDSGHLALLLSSTSNPSTLHKTKPTEILVPGL